MTTKNEALRLADSLERMSLSTKWDKQAAAELRRLHEVNQELLETLIELNSVSARGFLYDDPARVKARAAIAKATGEKTRQNK